MLDVTDYDEVKKSLEEPDKADLVAIEGECEDVDGPTTEVEAVDTEHEVSRIQTTDNTSLQNEQVAQSANESVGEESEYTGFSAEGEDDYGAEEQPVFPSKTVTAKEAVIEMEAESQRLGLYN